MKLFLRRIVVTALLVISSVGFALPMHEYGYKMRVTPAQQANVYKVGLPQIVYQHVYHANLQDLQLYNSQHEIVSTAILSSHAKDEQLQVALPVFPIDSTLPANNTFKLEISTNTQGAMVARTLNAQANIPSAENTQQALLIDLKPTQQKKIGDIKLKWQPSNNDFMHSLSVYSSQDLTHWQFMKTVRLVSLHFDGKKILQNKFSLSARYSRYVLLKWSAGATPLHIQSAEATVYKVGQPTFDSFIAKSKGYNQQAGGYVYAAPMALPASQINVKLPTNNQVHQYEVYARQTKQQAWQYQGALLSYKIIKQGTRLSNTPLSFPMLHAKYWLLKTTHQQKVAPVLQLGWLPQSLVFLHDDHPPYTLVFGSYHTTSPDRQLAMLISTKDSVLKVPAKDNARLSNFESLRGITALVAPDLQHKRKVILWGVIIAGVLLALWMVLSLVKQMKAAKE